MPTVKVRLVMVTEVGEKIYAILIRQGRIASDRRVHPWKKVFRLTVRGQWSYHEETRELYEPYQLGKFVQEHLGYVCEKEFIKLHKQLIRFPNRKNELNCALLVNRKFCLSIHIPERDREMKLADLESLEKATLVNASKNTPNDYPRMGHYTHIFEREAEIIKEVLKYFIKKTKEAN